MSSHRVAAFWLSTSSPSCVWRACATAPPPRLPLPARWSSSKDKPNQASGHRTFYKSKPSSFALSPFTTPTHSFGSLTILLHSRSSPPHNHQEHLHHVCQHSPRQEHQLQHGRKRSQGLLLLLVGIFNYMISLHLRFLHTLHRRWWHRAPSASHYPALRSRQR